MATVLIAGPTASGKSRLAVALAEALGEFGGGRIVNADALQVYRELRIVTARPGAADEAREPHGRYGVLSALDVCSAARWRGMAMAEIRAAHADGAVPIVVGGSGLYFKVLTEGIAAVPEIPEEVRREGRSRLAQLGAAGLHAEIAAADGESAAAIAPGDSQRVVRAWEVLEATGDSLLAWQRRAGPPEPLPGPVARLVLLPPREDVYAAASARVVRMVADGALDEVAAFARLDPAPDLPAARALGVPEFRAVLAGGLRIEDAVAAIQRGSRRYAKRQFTWYRHQATDWTVMAGDPGAQLSESFFPQVFPFIRQFLLTGQS